MDLNTIDLNKLHAFFIVADERGITRAAARLGVTRSAVSQSVSALEAALSARLFHRGGKAMTLTADGRLLWARLHDYHAELQRTFDTIANEAREVRGVARIGVYPGFPRLRLSRVLARFTAAHPAASVTVVYAPHRDLAARLADGRLDFLVSLARPTAGGARVRSSRLLRQELVLAGAPRVLRLPTSPPAARRPQPLELVAALPIVDYYRSDPLIHRWVRHHCGVKPPALRVAVWAATTDLALELLLAGAGIGVLPRDVVAPFVARRRLAIVAPSGPPLVDHVWLSELPSSYASPLRNVFRATLVEDLA